MRQFFALSLAAVALGATAQVAEVPWTVREERTPIHADPDRTSPQRGELLQGEAVSGEIVRNPETDEEWLAFASSGETWHVTTNDLIRVHPANLAEGDLPIGEEIVTRWWALRPDYEPSDLVGIPPAWCSDADREHRLRLESMESLVAMFQAARRDGVEIRVTSAYRSFESQRRNFRNAVRRLGPGERQVARPGHSEHQLGTTVDLVDPEGRHVLELSFGTTPQWRWLNEHAASFGWRQSYTEANTAETGYDPEPWHFRHFGQPATAEAVSSASPEIASD